jgi:hypothetical protein
MPDEPEYGWQHEALKAQIASDEYKAQRDRLLAAATRLVDEAYEVLPHECAKAWSAWAELAGAVRECEKEESGA